MSLAGYTGNILELKPDSTFTNRSYSDVVGFFNPRTNKGKWQSTSDSTIQLKYGCSKLDLIYRQYSNLIFLVPLSKLPSFEKVFTKNIENIQAVCEASFEDQHYLIYSKLADFSKICFISWNERPKGEVHE